MKNRKGHAGFAYGKGVATGRLRAKNAAELALTNLSPPFGSHKPYSVIVLLSGSEATLMMQEYGEVVETIHNHISEHANLVIDCVTSDHLGEQLEVSLVVEFFRPLGIEGVDGVQAE